MADNSADPTQAPGGGSRDAKVGSDPEAAKAFGGQADFGIPAGRATAPADGRGKGPDPGTGFSRSGSRGVRTSGVGAPVGTDGSGSGGDLDPDVIGLDGRGGVANNPREHKMEGPDITDGSRDPFASGPPAEGKPAPRSQGGRVFDTVDHSGGDASTTGDESDPTENPEIEEIEQEKDLDRTAADE